jgi:hypothetical protein
MRVKTKDNLLTRAIHGANSYYVFRSKQLMALSTGFNSHPNSVDKSSGAAVIFQNDPFQAPLESEMMPAYPWHLLRRDVVLFLLVGKVAFWVSAEFDWTFGQMN